MVRVKWRARPGAAALVAALVITGVSLVVPATLAKADALAVRVGPVRDTFDAPYTGYNHNAATLMRGHATLETGSGVASYFAVHANGSAGNGDPPADRIVKVDGSGTHSSLLGEGEVAADVAADPATSYDKARLFVATDHGPSIAVYDAGLHRGSKIDFTDLLNAKGSGSLLNATSITIDPAAHRGYVSLAADQDTLAYSAIGIFDTGSLTGQPAALQVVITTLTAPLHLAVDATTDVLYFGAGLTVQKLTSAGTSYDTGAMATFNAGDGSVGAMAAANGTVYVADAAEHLLWKILSPSSAPSSIATHTRATDLVVVNPSADQVSGRQLAIVGDSGCSDSTTANARGCVEIVADGPSFESVADRTFDFGAQAVTPVSPAYGSAVAVAGSGEVDDVGLTASTGIASITTTSLAPATVGVPYGASVLTAGGTSFPNLTTSWDAPPGGINAAVAFGSVALTGTPTTSGTFQLTVAGDVQPHVFTLTVNPSGCADSGQTRVTAGSRTITATSSRECQDYSLQNLTTGAGTGYRSVSRVSSDVEESVLVDLGGPASINQVSINPVTLNDVPFAYPAAGRITASNDAATACSATAPATISASLAGPPNFAFHDSSAYRYVCLTVTKLASVNGDYFFALRSFGVNAISASVPHGRVGTAYQATMTATTGLPGDNLAATVTTVEGALPAGLNVSASGNQVTIAGTPSAAGNYTFAVILGDGWQQQYTLVIDPVVAFTGPTNLTDATQCPAGGTCDSYDATIPVTGGPNTTVVLASGASLPAGLSLGRRADGFWHITGKLDPSVASGQHAFTLNASDDDFWHLPTGGTATATFTLNVLNPPVTFDPSTLPDAHMGLPYQATITVSGPDRQPLPDNVTLYLNDNPQVMSATWSNGMSVVVDNPASGSPRVSISGTPTSSNDLVTFKVCANPSGWCLTYNLYIPPAPTPTFKTQALLYGAVGRPYYASIDAGTATSVQLTGGTLPAGLTGTLNGSVYTISGIPTGISATALTFTARNGTGASAPTASTTMTLHIVDAPTIATATLHAVVGQPSNLSVEVNNADTVTLSGNALPGGLDGQWNAERGQFVITGIPEGEGTTLLPFTARRTVADGQVFSSTTKVTLVVDPRSSGGGGNANCDQQNASVASTDGSIAFTASSTHECGTFAETALLFDSSYSYNSSTHVGGLNTYVLDRPAGLSFLTGAQDHRTRETVTADLGKQSTVAEIDATAPADARGNNPTVRLSASSSTCADGAAIVAQAGHDYAGFPTWIFRPAGATQARYACFSADTVQLTSDRFADVVGKYAFGLTTLRVQDAVSPFGERAGTVVPGVTATLQLPASHDNVVEFSGTGWTGLTPKVLVSCEDENIDCSHTVAGWLATGTGVTATVTVDAAGNLTGQIVLDGAVPLEPHYLTISVVGTRADGSNRVVAAAASLDLSVAVDKLMTMGGGVIAYTDDPSSVHATAYDADGHVLGVAVPSQALAAGNNVLMPPWSARPSVFVTWPSASSPAVAYVQITVRTPSGIVTGWWQHGGSYLSLTSPFG